jgi:signal transduction histidine kinase
VRATPLRSESDDGRVIVVAQDVTRLTRIDRLKSDMVATVSHEFKTPLTSLRMATHLLLEPTTGPLTESQREVITTARDETERLRSLVDELLDLVRIESEAGALHRVSVDVTQLLRSVVDGHRAIAAAKGVALDIEEHAALSPARVDPEKLGIVLANLVSNAVRHTPAGGRVSLGAVTDAAALRITVRDSGEGVGPADLARLLERSTTRGGHEGAWRGLGLTIAQEIVLQHGGELLAESAVGRGSAFTVVIPREPEPAG